jgi:predicted nuclease of predicted toxin-antitoxin system
MKRLKLDENFPPSMADIFKQHQIDASSVYEQKLNGSDDEKVFDVCVNEERILVTFDLDFANIIKYPSDNTAGIIIVRTRAKVSLEVIAILCQRLAAIINQYDLNGKLYIVEDTKIRIRRPEEE